MLVQLEPKEIHDTAVQVYKSIQKDFPEAGLLKISNKLVSAAGMLEWRIRKVSQPLYGVICLSILALVVALAGLFWLLHTLRLSSGELTLTDLPSMLEAAVNVLIIAGLGIYSVCTLEKKDQKGASYSGSA